MQHACHLAVLGLACLALFAQHPSAAPVQRDARTSIGEAAPATLLADNNQPHPDRGFNSTVPGRARRAFGGCSAGFRDVTHGTSFFTTNHHWACGAGCDGGMYTDYTCGCACQPVNCDVHVRASNTCPALAWYNSYSPSTFAGAEKFCTSNGSRLATYAEYCAAGSVFGGKKRDGDQWAPYSGEGDNQWVQVGTSGHAECKKHTPQHGKPAWGTSTDKHSFENHVLCALTPISYQGCYNTGGQHIGGHSGRNTLPEACADQASTGSKPFFGMEWPQGSVTPGTASCAHAMTKLPTARVPDSECGTPYNGQRLGGPWRVAVYALAVPSDAFKVIFVSDLERDYRGHTDRDIEDVMDEIIAQKPALVIHGGDNYDNEHSGNKARKYYTKLLDNGIPFITTNGNHDGADSAAEAFVHDSYVRTADLAKSSRKFTFTYDQPSGAHGYKAEFNGLQIASFLWKGKWGKNKKNEDAIVHDELTPARANAMKLKLDPSKPTLVVNHHPNMAAVNTLVQALPVRSAVFSGHTHDSNTREIASGYLEYTAPYAHQWGSMDYGVAKDRKERGMLSVLVSPTKGVISVTQIDTVLKSRTWSDGTRCSSTVLTPASDTCHKCKNGWDWWGSKFGHHCGPALEYGREWGVPMKDQGCPPHYRDTGLTCTRCYWRGWSLKCNTIGSLGCDAGQEQVGLLCYKPCRAGYRGSGLYCTKR